MVVQSATSRVPFIDGSLKREALRADVGFSGGIKMHPRRQAITTQSNASPLPGCFSTPPFISLPSAAFNHMPSQKNCFHVLPSLRIVPSSVPSPPLSLPLPRTPAPEEKYIEGRRKKNDSEERRFNSYVRWLQLLLVQPSEKTR
ncbi:hypothetical protein CEXT_395181 [Caerostris extrusa]|uniref:Uncharacterized protein n=1 Tax=Caerostris extrusa TaxID=172846 RepID=A0AAV4WD86_CAEEX|nr:hypothetical protein CEXT_395181 [Caerostris extrusa]